MAKFEISRRKFLTAASLGASGIMLSGCDAFDSQLSIGSGLRSFLENANGLTHRAQRLLGGGNSLALEFTEADIRQPMRPNGVTAPDDDAYKALLANNFADWRLEVSG
ncbi:molybdopterin oxidoreductase, partial [Mesorhizobium sp. M2D.F.Ca.ET.145.01.1.1]